MSHELAFRADGSAAMAYAFGSPLPWHDLGQMAEKGATLDRWRELSGTDFEIKRAKVQYEVGDEMRTIHARDVLLRADTGAHLGIVSAGYKIFQPSEVMEFFRDLIDGMGFELETAGVLYGGAKFWALAKVTEACTIADLKDKVGLYLLLTTSADGTMATQARWTGIRVVCRNTLTIAVGRGAAHFTLPHSAEFDEDAAREALGISRRHAQARFTQTIDAFRRMAETRVTSLDMLKMTLEAFKHDPREMTAKQIMEAAELPTVKAVGALAKGNGLIGGDMAGVQGTVWGWLNGVTQYADHEAGGTRRSISRRLDSAWMGQGDLLKRRALTIAGMMAGANFDAPTGGDEADAEDAEADLIEA